MKLSSVGQKKENFHASINKKTMKKRLISNEVEQSVDVILKRGESPPPFCYYAIHGIYFEASVLAEIKSSKIKKTYCNSQFPVGGSGRSKRSGGGVTGGADPLCAARHSSVFVIVLLLGEALVPN